MRRKGQVKEEGRRKEKEQKNKRIKRNYVEKKIYCKRRKKREMIESIEKGKVDNMVKG